MLAFTRMNAALANCTMDQDAMTSAMAGRGDQPCEGCDTPVSDPRHQISSACAAHCASAEQPTAVAAGLVISKIERVAFVLPHLVLDARPTGLEGPPSGAPPRRILLHSFLI
jgi:hypothetical protein